jgi:2-methylcitrate dehydratase PrpD
VDLRDVMQWAFDEPAPSGVREKARLVLLDTMGCALAGLARPSVAAFAAALQDQGALTNGALLATAACWDEACEGLARAHGRPGVPVIAACMALAGEREITLGRILDAVITGYEIGGRMGEALRIRPGMHVDASWPALGVAAGVARLLGGSAEQGLAAVEIAASQIPFGLYLPVEQGADSRNTYLGHAAWLGSFAAFAAMAGSTAPSGAVERFARLALGIDALKAQAKGRYVIREAYLKAFAAVRHVHYGALAALSLKNHLPDLDAIRAIELAIYPEALAYCANRAPRTAIQAQFSLSFGLAAALRFGSLDSEVYRAPLFDDPDLRRLEQRVELRAEERFAQGGQRAATLTIRTDTQNLEKRIDAIPPLTAEECRAKFLKNAARLGVARASTLAEAIFNGSENRKLRIEWNADSLQVVVRPLRR